MDREEKAWIDSILASVRPLTPEEVQGLKEAWMRWAWYQAHDEDCRQDFQGAKSIHLRLIVTLEQAWASH